MSSTRSKELGEPSGNSRSLPGNNSIQHMGTAFRSPGSCKWERRWPCVFMIVLLEALVCVGRRTKLNSIMWRVKMSLNCVIITWITCFECSFQHLSRQGTGDQKVHCSHTQAVAPSTLPSDRSLFQESVRKVTQSEGRNDCSSTEFGHPQVQPLFFF